MGLVHNAHTNSFTSHIMYKEKHKEPGLVQCFALEVV